MSFREKSIRILSYIYPITVSRYPLINGHELEVRLENGKKVLNSKKANYSFGSLHRIWQQGLTLVDISSTDRVLVLGAGVGSIARILHHEMKKPCNLVLVEHDHRVLQIMEEHFYPMNEDLTQIVIDDAFDHCANSTDRFEFILVDLFIDMDVPTEMLTPDFWNDVIRLLEKGGKVVVNSIDHDSKSKSNLALLRSLLHDRFRSVEESVLQGINHLFVCSGIKGH